MRVFLTGATGYIGSAVLDALVRAGHDVSALVRSAGAADRVERKGARPVRGDLAKPDSYRKSAAGFEAYVHAAFDSSGNGPALELQTVGTLLDLLGAGAGGTLIYTSGVWILGSTTVPATEDAALNPPELVAWRADVERKVLAGHRGGIRTAVVRPGIVYGGARGIISDMLTDADNGLMRVIGSGENHWAVVYDRDVGELYARLLATPQASGIFHATDESRETVHDIVEAIAAQPPTRPEVRYMPLAEARKKLGGSADALVLDQMVASPKARALGWSPTLSNVTRNIPRLYEEWRNARREEGDA